MTQTDTVFSRLRSGSHHLWLHLRQSGWTAVVCIIAALTAIPVLVVFSSVFTPSGDIWAHLSSTVLPIYIRNSLILMLGVGTGVLVLGISTAWLVTMCRFPGSSVLEWALLLPLAAPAYLLAYTYTDLLDYYGIVQTTLRTLFHWSRATDYWFPDIRTIGGAILLLSLVLYPYVYLLARVAFLEQSTSTLEASRSLGCNPWRSFTSVALPMARPAVMAGLSLALMETLNDFGTVDFFGVQTFTTGIYRTWFSMGERVAAAQLAATLMIFILGLILVERWSRRQAQYFQGTSRQQPLSPYHLAGWRGLGAQIICWVPVVLGLLLPAGQLLYMTIRYADETLNRDFVTLASHSLLLAALTSLFAVVISLVLAYGVRLNQGIAMRFGVRVAALGYAIPGSVIAVGILIPVAHFDTLMNSWLQSGLGLPSRAILNGTIWALIFAYLVRFLAVALGAVESGLAKIRPSLDDAARSLGRTPASTLVRIHTPLMTGSLLTGVMLVFVDVMKELPATLVMRPFNFDTLAVQVFRYAADERLTEAGAPALAILLVGLLPVILLSWQVARSRVRGM